MDKDTHFKLLTYFGDKNTCRMLFSLTGISLNVFHAPGFVIHISNISQFTLLICVQYRPNKEIPYILSKIIKGSANEFSFCLTPKVTSTFKIICTVKGPLK